MRFCNQCGTALGEQDAFCPVCGSEVSVKEAHHTCASCGAAISDEDQFCSACGAPTGNQKVYQGTVQTPGRRSKLVAGLLGIFVGAWGIHNFYLGKISLGVIQISVTLVTCGVGGLWGFIEGILILCDRITVDGDGNPLNP